MKKIWAIVPAAVLGIGAATAGVLANASSADKKGISIDYLPVYSNDSEQIDEKTSASTVSSQAGVQNYLVTGTVGEFCDNYIDGVCWQDGSGCGYHHGNGNYANGAYSQNGSGHGHHHANGNHH